MRIHVLGICGTFMGSLALLAKESGHQVSGSDRNAYPPMNGQLAAAGIPCHEGYDRAALRPPPDLVVVGNALSRGNEAIEYMLDCGLPYISGPQWLREQALGDRHVIAVAGTHGKTTVASMLALLLERAGLQPGFLIGGVPLDFGVSARMGSGAPFIVEADEYDTAFFDKRSKFVHYRPRTLVVNNIEYDHADIFPDLAAIQTQFSHLLRTVPASGQVIVPAGDPAVDAVLAAGCWSALSTTGVDASADLRAELLRPDGSEFLVDGRHALRWSLCGEHNVRNALSALAVARQLGVALADGVRWLASFRGVKRRLEKLSEPGGVSVYDDFAHHPTAIRATLDGLRAQQPSARIIAVIEPRSNSMRAGVHAERLAEATRSADYVFWYRPEGVGWPLERLVSDREDGARASVRADVDEIVEAVSALSGPGDRVVVMSNGGFERMSARLVSRLDA